MNSDRGNQARIIKTSVIIAGGNLPTLANKWHG